MNRVFQMFNSLKIKRLTTEMKKLVAKKDYYKTIDCANEILDLDENNLLALKIKSDALRQLGDFEGALECANIIVDLDVADECDNVAEGKLTAITANINGVGNIQSVTLSSHTLVYDNQYSKILLNKGLV